MKHSIIRLSLSGIAVIIGLAGYAVPVKAVGEALAVRHVVIAEIAPESLQSGSEEYVELFNSNATDVDITGWRLQYRSASHKASDTSGWSIKAILGCESTKPNDCATMTTVIIGAGESARLSSYEQGDDMLRLAAGMATSGGEVRLVRPDPEGDVIHDMVGYGSALTFEGEGPATAPKAGQSIVRHQDEHGIYLDGDQNGDDFVLAALPPSDKDNAQEPGVIDGEEANDGSEPEPGKGALPLDYPDAEITEVLPDPASPLMDSSDEFIELYNPYGQPLDLTGYSLKAGTDWTHSYTVTGVTIAPYGYVALLSSQTHLSLSNSGSGVRLYDPGDRLIVEIPSYGKAKTGNSWVRDAHGQWVWTTKPTPGETNILEAPTQPNATATTSSKKTTTKSTTAAKKASAPKAPSGAVKGLTTTASQPAEVQATENHVGLWALAGAGVLGVGYALFEYRRDIGDFIRRRWESLVGLVRR